MALKKIPLEVIEAHFTTERLMRSFSRRLGYLHDSDEAVRVVTKWLAADGLLNDVAQFNELGLTMFNNIAPVAPPATLAAIERALAGPNAGAITSESWRRDRIAYLLRSLAHDAQLFERSFAALMMLAGAEVERSRMHPVQDVLKGLFHLYFSGTHASVEQRLSALHPLLQSDDTQKRTHGVTLLGAMLNANHFSSTHSFEFGARPRDFGFWPKTYGDEQHWYLSVLAVVQPLACSNLPIAEAVRAELASELRGLWYKGATVQTKLEEITQGVLRIIYWQQGWVNVRLMLAYPRENTSEETLARLHELEKSLRPKNVAEQVRAVVLSQSSGTLDFADSEEDDDNPISPYERAAAAAEELGKEVARDRTLFSSLLPDLVQGGGVRLNSFGVGLARGAGDRRDTWNMLSQALAAIPADKQNISALCGFLIGSNNDDTAFCEALLEEALDNEVLAYCFPVLQTSVPITERGAQRLKLALALGKAPVRQFTFLGWGRASDAISAADLSELLFAIASRPDGYAVATDILSMRFHSERDKKVDYPRELVETGRVLLSEATFDNRDNMHDYRMRMIVNVCLPGEDGKAAARALCEKFNAGLIDYSVYEFHYDQLLEGLFKTQPRIALDVFFEGGGGAADIHRFDDPSDHRKKPLDAVPDDEILGWCQQIPETRYAAMARAVSFFVNVKDTPMQWTPIALKMMDAAPNPTAILEIFINRFSPRSWSGSRAAIMESRTRLLGALTDHPNVSVAAMAREAQPVLQAAVERERRRETERDQERDERFE